MNQNIYQNTHQQSHCEQSTCHEAANFHPAHYLPHQPHPLLQQFSKESSLSSSTPPPPTVNAPGSILPSASPGSYCALGINCPFGITPHVHAAHGVLTRSKSLDDLISLSNPSSEESCSSCEFHCGPSSRSPVTVTSNVVGSVFRPLGHRVFLPSPSSNVDPNTLPPLNFNDPPHIALAALGLSGITSESIASGSASFSTPAANSLQAPIPGHHHSHHQLGHEGSLLPPCDTVIYDTMLQRMSQLKMN